MSVSCTGTNFLPTGFLLEELWLAGTFFFAKRDSFITE